MVVHVTFVVALVIVAALGNGNAIVDLTDTLDDRRHLRMGASTGTTQLASRGGSSDSMHRVMPA